MNPNPELGHAVDPAIWQLPQMREALRQRDIREVFTLLNRRGYSQRHIAALCRQGQGDISAILAGRKVLAYDLLARIAAGLGIPRGYLGIAYTEDAPVPPVQQASLDDPGQRQQFVATLAGFAVGGTQPGIEQWLPTLPDWPGPPPAAVTPATVHTIREITERHRRLDAAHGGGSCRDSAVGYLTWARCLLRSDCKGDELNAELRKELADLHNLVGWMCHDLGDNSDARRYLAQGLVLAQQAGESSLMADAYYRLGRVSIHQDDPREALHLFQLGQIVAQNSGSLTSVAILHANIGWAHARMGNDADVRDSLARAVDELARADTDTAPDWTRFFSNADLDGMRGLVFASLARHDEHRRACAPLAIEHATAALRRRPDPSRSGAFDHVTVAIGNALEGDAAGVVPHAQAVVAAAGGVRSRRLLDRLADVADVAAPLSRGSADVRDVLQAIRALPAA